MTNQLDVVATGHSGLNPKRTHFNAGTSQYSSGASFAQEFRNWLYNIQREFANQEDFAAAINVSLETLRSYLRGQSFPSDLVCDKLWKVTTLPCFSPEGRAAARLEHLQKKGLSRSAILKHTQRQYVTADELAECRTDPERAFTVRGDDWIICLECGQLLKQIRDKGSAAHLNEHSMLVEQYREGPDPEHPRYGKNRGLICNALANKKADAARANTNLVPDHDRKYLRSPAKGRVMPPEFSRKTAARMRGQRKEEWSKDISDVEFVWNWAVEEKAIKEVAKIISGSSPDGSFSKGGVWVRLKAILGRPVRKTLTSEPDQGSAERAAMALENGTDDAKLKSEVDKLCAESRNELREQNRRGIAGTAILLIPRMRAWRRQNLDVLTTAALARRFLADRAWITTRPRGEKKRTRQGHPPGPRKRTQLRNEMAAICEIQERRQKEVADDFFPDKLDIPERMDSTFDYFSHHRTEIEKEKTRLRDTPVEQQQAMYARDCNELLKALAKKRRNRPRKSSQLPTR